MRGGVIGALLYEGMAKTAREAQALAASGAIEYSPCHEHAAVGPMAGIVSPSMPVFIVRNEEYGNTAYATMNEGLGKVLRYGAYGPAITERLKWMEETLYPALQKAIAKLGKVDLKNIIAQALHMGDEVHNRNRAATSLLFRLLAPAVVRTAPDAEQAARVLEFINGNDHFFLNLSMAASKATLDAARDTPPSSVVVAMARNGTDFGIQLAGTGGAVVHRTRAGAGCALLPRLHQERRQPRHRRQRHHRDQRPGRLRHRGLAGHRAVRGRRGLRRPALHAADVRDHGRREQRLPDSRPQFPRAPPPASMSAK